MGEEVLSGLVVVLFVVLQCSVISAGGVHNA